MWGGSGGVARNAVLIIGINVVEYFQERFWVRGYAYIETCCGDGFSWWILLGGLREVAE